MLLSLEIKAVVEYSFWLHLFCLVLLLQVAKIDLKSQPFCVEDFEVVESAFERNDVLADVLLNLVLSAILQDGFHKFLFLCIAFEDFRLSLNDIFELLEGDLVQNVLILLILNRLLTLCLADFKAP